MPCLAHEKVGIALNTLGNLPVNGVRHLVEGGTCGWYFWCGEELLSDEDFFKPLHFAHLDKFLPEVIPYTALPSDAKSLRILVPTDFSENLLENSFTSIKPRRCFGVNCSLGDS